MEPGDVDATASSVTGGRRRTLVVASVVALLLLGALAAGVVIGLGDRPDPVSHDFVVPAGTADRVSSGEVVRILPSDLEVRVGDRLIIRNEDKVDFTIGPYTVRSGETLEQTFHRRGAITGECGLTPTNDIRIFIH